MATSRHFVWHPETTPAELHPLLDTLGEEYPLFAGGRGIRLAFEPVKKAESTYAVRREKGTITVTYSP